MSSILNALKRLENQATDQSQVRPWESKRHMQDTLHEQINGHKRFRRGYVIIVASLVFAVCSGVVLSQILHEKKQGLMTKNETFFKKPISRPEQKAVIPDKNKKELSSRKNGKKIKPIAKIAEPIPSPAQIPKRNIVVLPSQKASPPKQAKKVIVTEKRSETSEQNTTADRFESVQVKQSNQTKIELQAIAWSDDPKSRLAVINGLILRERESIDNVIVMHIGKDAVIFKKGGEEWKQMFGF